MQTTSDQVNTQLGQLALQLRNTCRSIVNFSEWANTWGTAGLEGIGFSADDAQAVLNACGLLANVAGVFFGTATQGANYDFDNAVSTLYGGQ
jgi:hypothetical protein